jgi:hypothetical protein
MRCVVEGGSRSTLLKNNKRWGMEGVGGGRREGEEANLAMYLLKSLPKRNQLLTGDKFKKVYI